MVFYPNRTVAEQKSRLPLEYQSNYEATQLDRIEIDGETIQGYFEYSFTEEKSYTVQPTRSNEGTIEGLDDITTFLTPRLIIKYNMMNIEDYRKLMKLLKSKNSFNVTCYDIVEDKRVTHEMYFAPPQMPIIYQQYLKVLGIQECSIELIGTNRDASVKIHYDFSSAKDYGIPLSGYETDVWAVADKSFVVGGGIYVENASGDSVPLSTALQQSGYGVIQWVSNSGNVYANKEQTKFSTDITLYAEIDGI